MHTSVVVTAAVAGLALAAPAAATAQQGAGDASSFTAKYSTVKPGKSAGFSIRVTGSPPPAGVQLAPFLRQTVRFAAGTRIDTGAKFECTATDADIAAQGARPLCPAASRIGTGVAEGVLNGNPVRFNLVAYNFPGRIHFGAEANGASLKQGFWGTYAGRTLVIDVPTANGTLAPTLFRADIAGHHHKGRAYVTTPRRCSSTRRWRITATFIGLQSIGGPTVGKPQDLSTTSPCRQPAGSKKGL